MFTGMRLADYLAQNDISDSAFAERIGVTRQTLWRYKAGERRPEWDVLERISQETGGQVTPNDFLDRGDPPSDPHPVSPDPAPKSPAPSAVEAA